MKGKMIAFLLAVVLLTGGAVAYNATAVDPMKDLKSSLKAVKDNPNKDVVFAKVEDVPVTKGEVEKAKLILQSMHDLRHDGKKATDEDGLKVIMKETAIQKAAKEMAITVSDQEVKEMVASNKAGFETHANEQERQFMNSIIDAMGLTEEQYWNEYSIQAGKQQLLEMKLKESFTQKYAGLRQNPEPNQVQEAWDEYVDGLTKKVKVTN